MTGNRLKFFRRVVGNIVICASIAGVLAIALFPVAQNADVRSEPIYSGRSDREVSLMINVYWGTEYIAPMLDILDRYNARTTFFVGGSWAAGNTDTLVAICSAGHELGNHGYYHKDHKNIDEAYNIKEISAAHDTVKAATGVDMTLFAPPSGAFSDATLSAASSLGYRTVMWTRDTIDWRDHDPELIYSRAVRDIKGGDLILMHPTECTVRALGRIIAEIYKNDLRIAPVSKVVDGLVGA